VDSPLHILLSDDEEIVHQTIVSYLHDLGHRVDAVYDGSVALKSIQEHDYDVAILDEKMPGMNGIDLLAKAQEIRPEMPVIIITGHGTMDTAIQALKLGASEYLIKPIRLLELDTVLEKCARIRSLTIQREYAEERLRESEEELLKAQKLESIGVLVGGIAHELDNLLTGVIGNISLARVYEDPTEKGIKLAEAEKASMQIKKLIQHLLIFSDNEEPILQMVNAERLLRDSASFALRDASIECEFSIPDDLWPIEVDEGQMSQAISNLVINADQAMPVGGTARISAENMTMDTTSDLPLEPGSYIKISIEDQGIGISKKYHEEIFAPFFTTKQAGSGLGLAVAHSIIQKHGGYITVQSELDSGSTFHIYLLASPEQVHN